VGTLVLAFGATVVAGAGLLFSACLRLRSGIGFLLAAYLLASAEIVSVSLLLSTGGWLTRDALLAALVVAFVLAALTWVRCGRPRPPLSAGTVASLRETLRDPAVAALAVIAVVAHLYLVAGALTVPQSVTDTLLYHLPRAALWKQQHAVVYVANAPDERINAFPPNAEIESMISMVLSGGDRYVSIVQLVALLFACVAIVGVSRRLGLSWSAGVFGALAFSTFTVVALQTPTALNDLVVASLLIICAYFAMATSRAELTLAALALALALGTKLTVVFALPALAVFVLSSQPRRRWASLMLFGAVGVVAGSFWLIVNLLHTGRLDAGVAVDRSDGAFERIRLSVLDLLELSDAEGKGLLASPLWGLGVLVPALLVAAALAARKRWRASGFAVLVGAAAFAALPMLSTWVQVANRAFGQVQAAVGLTAAASGARLPDGLYESPMHSSYGVAFVLLFLGAGALVVGDVARRKLSVAPLVALAGVPLTLVILALALSYDPQHMRYIAFPVALATAVFGVALRVRIFAWTAVAVTAATLTVTLVYFAPRPAGLVILPENRETNRSARWLVQGESGKGDPEAFRFLEQEIPADATLALDVQRDTYLYPAWDARLRRTVLFADENGSIPESAGWLVVGPRQSIDAAGLSRAGWRLQLASAGGWRVFRR
jgi:hypothetical protein